MHGRLYINTIQLPEEEHPGEHLTGDLYAWGGIDCCDVYFTVCGKFESVRRIQYDWNYDFKCLDVEYHICSVSMESLTFKIVEKSSTWPEDALYDHEIKPGYSRPQRGSDEFDAVLRKNTYYFTVQKGDMSLLKDSNGRDLQVMWVPFCKEVFVHGKATFKRAKLDVHHGRFTTVRFPSDMDEQICTKE